MTNLITNNELKSILSMVELKDIETLELTEDGSVIINCVNNETFELVDINYAEDNELEIIKQNGHFALI